MAGVAPPLPVSEPPADDIPPPPPDFCDDRNVSDDRIIILSDVLLPVGTASVAPELNASIDSPASDVRSAELVAPNVHSPPPDASRTSDVVESNLAPPNAFHTLSVDISDSTLPVVVGSAECNGTTINSIVSESPDELLSDNQNAVDRSSTDLLIDASIDCSIVDPPIS